MCADNPLRFPFGLASLFNLFESDMIYSLPLRWLAFRSSLAPPWPLVLAM